MVIRKNRLITIINTDLCPNRFWMWENMWSLFSDNLSTFYHIAFADGVSIDVSCALSTFVVQTRHINISLERPPIICSFIPYMINWRWLLQFYNHLDYYPFDKDYLDVEKIYDNIFEANIDPLEVQKAPRGQYVSMIDVNLFFSSCFLGQGSENVK